MVTMSSSPVNFSTNSTLIFSVIECVATVGSSQLRPERAVRALSVRRAPGVERDHDARERIVRQRAGLPGGQLRQRHKLQITNLPANLNVTGGMLYVTEIYTTHTLITPLNRFGIAVPTQLYSIAYF